VGRSVSKESALQNRQFFDNLLQDICYLFRLLRRSPGFWATAVAALALAIGANAAIFTVVNTVLLQPLACPQPDRLVQLELSGAQGNGNVTSIPKYKIWREQTQVFQDVAAYDEGGPGVNLTGGDRPEQLKGVHVSASFFQLFGASVAAGRAFSADQDRPGGARLVVISNGLWRRRFAADPNVVGKNIELGGEPYLVTGALAATFTSDPPADIYLPLQADPNSTHQAHYLRSAARRKPGVTLKQAQAAMKLAAERYKRKFAGRMGLQDTFTAEPLRDTLIGEVRKWLLILLGAIGSYGLMAYSVQLRTQEIGIRMALRAGPQDVRRMVVKQGLRIALIGVFLGVAAALALARLMASLRYGLKPWDPAAIISVAVLLGAVALLATYFPAQRASRVDPMIALRYE
jgi:putative ABC transport system permease protein